MRIRCLLVLVVAGCSAPPQVITGRIDPGTFPAPVTGVKVTTTRVQSWHGNALVTVAGLGADGTFRVDIPPMDGVRIQLLADAGQSTLVFPRALGTIDRAFTIRAGGSPFDLGMIRFVGDAAASPLVFKPTGTGGDPDCEDDGEDASGATCVDDEDSDAGSCDDDSDSDSDSESDDDGDTDDDADTDDDGDTDDDASDPQDGPNMGDSTAERNFPADGCAADDEDSEDDD